MPPPRVYRHRGKSSKTRARPAMERNLRMSSQDSPQARTAGGRLLRGPPRDTRCPQLRPLAEGLGLFVPLTRAVQGRWDPRPWTPTTRISQHLVARFCADGAAS